MDTEHIKNFVEELQRENKELKKLIEMFFIGEDEDGQGWVQFGHPDIKDGCLLRVDPKSMSGKVVMKYGKILKDVKSNLTT